MMATISKGGMSSDSVPEHKDDSESPTEGRLETTISLKIGEVKGLQDILGGKPRDIYVSVHLDQEELYRTATIEKTLNPLIAEQFNFMVPDNFSRMTCYVCDGETVSLRDQRLGHVMFTREELTISHEFPTEKWYQVHSVTPDSEVQGKILVSVDLLEQLESTDTASVILVKVLEASGLASWSNCGPFSDAYCAVNLISTGGVTKSEVRKGLIRKRTISPSFGDVFRFKLAKNDILQDTIIKITVWHQQMICDVFLGQVHLSLSSEELTQSRSYEAWYSLCPRSEYTPTDIGSIRLLVSYHEDYILPAVTYQPLLSLLLTSLTDIDFSDSALSILHEVSKDRSAMGQCIVKLFLQLNKFEELATRLITVEVNSTSDPNTLFRGNSVASKVIDEFMKTVGQSYLHRTLQSCIDEIFDIKRSCEIDHSKLSEGENIDLNMTNLLFFVEKIMSAITNSARSCPSLMKKTFSILRQLSIQKFPSHKDEVSYTAISGFIFLRFFAPAILNPKLFGLRPENPNLIVSRTLLLISKTIQNLGNIGARQRGSSLRKEDFMVPLLAELMDPQHMKAVKNYLDCIATEDPVSTVDTSLPYREGFLIKRALARKKITVKNFKKRYFVLSDNGLSYSKCRGDSIINTIPIEDMLAVERVDEGAFNMKFMLQLIQPERVLYLQAKNSVDQMEWLSALAKSCYHSNSSYRQLVHSGSFSGQWTCCGSHTVEQPGCRKISLAIKLLAGPEATSKETELNKIYRLLLDSQERLLNLKAEASKSTRSSVSVDHDENQQKHDSPTTSDSNGSSNGGSELGRTVLPLRLQTICELIVIIKNLELASKSLLLRRPQKLGSKESPYRCNSSEAYVIK